MTDAAQIEVTQGDQDAADAYIGFPSINDRLIQAFARHRATAAAQAREEAGYIVGNGDRTKWRAWDNGFPAWVDNPAEATRYARPRDANAVHAEDEDAWCVVKLTEALTTKAIP